MELVRAANHAAAVPWLPILIGVAAACIGLTTIIFSKQIVRVGHYDENDQFGAPQDGLLKPMVGVGTFPIRTRGQVILLGSVVAVIGCIVIIASLLA